MYETKFAFWSLLSLAPSNLKLTFICTTSTSDVHMYDVRESQLVGYTIN